MCHLSRSGYWSINSDLHQGDRNKSGHSKPRACRSSRPGVFPNAWRAGSFRLRLSRQPFGRRTCGARAGREVAARYHGSSPRFVPSEARVKNPGLHLPRCARQEPSPGVPRQAIRLIVVSQPAVGSPCPGPTYKAPVVEPFEPPQRPNRIAWGLRRRSGPSLRFP
jgi:hypothetical protein